jgi:hypothetical protein
MFTPTNVANWMVIIYERQQRFNEQTANQMASELVKACDAVGTTTFCRLSDFHAYYNHRNIDQPSAGTHKMGIRTSKYHSGPSPLH